MIQAAIARDLSSMLQPRSIALIGATDRSTWSKATFTNLTTRKYGGRSTSSPVVVAQSMAAKPPHPVSSLVKKSTSACSWFLPPASRKPWQTSAPPAPATPSC